jgi:hypothetical protein
MKKNRLILIGMLILLTFLLSGCLSITQEIWVNADGSGKIKIDMGLGEIFFQMGDSSTSNPLEDMKTSFQAETGTKNLKVSEYTDDKAQMRHVVIEFEVDNVEQYMLQSASQNSTMGAPMTLEKLANGNYLLKQTISNPSPDTTGGEMDQATKDMMADYFKDVYWTVTVHVPSIVSTNGTQSGQTVEWKIPMGDLFLGGKTEDLSLEYSLTPAASTGWLLYVIIGAVVVLLVIILVVILSRRKKEPVPLPPQQ